MTERYNLRFGRPRGTHSHDDEFNLNDIRPHGRFGVGTLTGHPVGLVVVVAVVLMALQRLPGAGLFILASLAAGGLFGFILWLRHC